MKMFLLFLLVQPAYAEGGRGGDYAVCLSQAAADFGLSENLLQAIKRVESGQSLVAPVRTNKNGTEDIGLFQINTFWLRHLARRGISRKGLLDPCVNTYAGAWILSQAVADADGDIWQGVGIYHSRNPRHQANYRSLVARRLRETAGG